MRCGRCLGPDADAEIQLPGRRPLPVHRDRCAGRVISSAARRGGLSVRFRLVGEYRPRGRTRAWRVEGAIQLAALAAFLVTRL